MNETAPPPGLDEIDEPLHTVIRVFVAQATERAERIDQWIQEISERLSLATRAIVHQRQARVLSGAAATLAGVAVVMSLGIVWRNIQIGDSQANRNEAQIHTLQIQLAAALATVQTGADNVEKARVADAAAVECLTRFDANVETANNTVQGLVGELVVVIATTIPGTDRDASLSDRITRLSEATDFYNRALMMRDQFRTKPTVACPIN